LLAKLNDATDVILYGQTLPKRSLEHDDVTDISLLQRQQSSLKGLVRMHSCTG